MTTIHQNDPKGYGALAPVLVDRGYIPIPCQGKQPRLKCWQDARAEQITDLLNDHAGDNTGVVLGDTLLVADIDIKDNATAAKGVAQRVQEVLGAGGRAKPYIPIETSPTSRQRPDNTKTVVVVPV